jgi:hypothetical protein
MEVITEIWQSEWRIYLAPVTVLAGLFLALRGGSLALGALRLAAAEADKNLRLMTGFRSAIVGTAVAAVAAGWLWQVEGLVVAAALVGAGELCETSVDIWALRRQLRTTSARRPASSST